MMDYEKWISVPPFSLCQEEKEREYAVILSELQKHHMEKCPEYKRLCLMLGENPAIPVRLFKEYELKSISREDIYKTMTSSGTTGQAVSKIVLDRATAIRQSKVLSRIVSDFTGGERLPMLILDSNSVLKDRKMFSARGAGILGFSMLGRDLTYALDENMELNMPVLEQFCEKYNGRNVIMYGFTYMIWQYFYKELKKQGRKLPIKGTVIHGGGWKKLQGQAVSPEEFDRAIKSVTDATAVLNYYGMVEQTGSIYMECTEGHLHASIFSEIEILRGEDLQPAGIGERGVIQTTSILPTSYPGHILLTEDEGELLGIDNCPCGRKGKYFKVYGRIEGAEIRGCSDTYEKH